MFRYKSGINVSYNRQGNIQFVSRRYKALPPEDQQEIKSLCLESGGEL